MNPNVSRNPDDARADAVEAWLDAQSRASLQATAARDDAFTARVMAALPAAREPSVDGVAGVADAAAAAAQAGQVRAFGRTVARARRHAARALAPAAPALGVAFACMLLAPWFGSVPSTAGPTFPAALALAAPSPELALALGAACVAALTWWVAQRGWR